MLLSTFTGYWQQRRLLECCKGYYDIQNIHIYVDWGKFRKQSIADKEIEEAERFRELMVKYGEEDKNFWITEIGWWVPPQSQAVSMNSIRRTQFLTLNLSPSILEGRFLNIQ